tara:strand:- start:365 stop:787 length:423 start_codon:yes stop_codon:yes gene_type:complete
MKINKTIIKQCSEIMDELGLSVLEYTEGKVSIKISKDNLKISKIPVNDEKKQISNNGQSNDDLDNSLKAPLVGTIYLRPEPGAKKFVEIGQKVKTGDILLIIEAMKTMNEIKSDKDGEIKKIFVNDASPVEFGEPLMLIK